MLKASAIIFGIIVANGSFRPALACSYACHLPLVTTTGFERGVLMTGVPRVGGLPIKKR